MAREKFRSNAYSDEFIVNAEPWVTQSTVTGFVSYQMTQVPQWLVVTNESAAAMRVAFSEDGLKQTTRYIELEQDESLSAEVRFNQLWLSGSGNTAQIIIGLADIPIADVMAVTSSNGSNV